MSAERFRISGPSPEPAAEPERPATVAQAPEVGERGEFPPDLVFIVDHTGQVLFVNRALGALTEEDVIGSEIFDWIFPEQHELVQDCLDRVRASGEPAGCEIPGIQHYDADAWYECRLTPNQRDGRTVSVTIIARDITRHKRAQQRMRTRLVELERLAEDRSADLQQARQGLDEALAAREMGTPEEADAADRRFRALVDAAGEAIFVTDVARGEVVDVNETACRWLRLPREEILGRTVVDLDLEFPVLPPEDADLQFTETRDTRRPLVLSGGVHRRQDGSTFPVEVAVASHEMEGRDVVLAVVRDVKGRQRIEDALHEREARYWSLFDQSWDAIYVTTRAGVVTEVNPAAGALFGYPEDEFEGLDARELIPEPADIRKWQKAMAADGVVERLPIAFRRRDGTLFAGLLSAARLRDREGNIQGYQCLVRPAAPSEPPPATAPESGEAGEAADEAPQPGTPGRILVVDANATRREEVADALTGAGYAVESEADPARAAERARAGQGGWTAVVVGLQGEGASGEWALRSIRALDEGLPLLAVVDNARMAQAAGRLEDLGLAATLPAPVHPLALIQALRAVVTAG